MWERPVKRARFETAQEQEEWEELLKQAREYTGPLATPKSQAETPPAPIPLPLDGKERPPRNTTGKLV